MGGVLKGAHYHAHFWLQRGTLAWFAKNLGGMAPLAPRSLSPCFYTFSYSLQISSLMSVEISCRNSFQQLSMTIHKNQVQITSTLPRLSTTENWLQLDRSGFNSHLHSTLTGKRELLTYMELYGSFLLIWDSGASTVVEQDRAGQCH